MAFIELRNIAKTYRLGEIDLPVLRDVSLTINRGEFVALMGASGSGKTTLMNILGCLDRPSSGQYWLEGHEIGGLSADERALLRNQKIGFVFQTFNLLSRTSALDNVLMPLTYTTSPLSEREARQRAEALLQRMGLGDRLHHLPAQLSGGQQQRVAIARALINQPALLFADEPTGNLDSRTSEEVLRLFQQLNGEEGVTIILVTHDEHVAQYAKRTIRIRDGAIINEGAISTLSQAETGTTASPPNRGEWQGGRRWARFMRLLYTALTGLRRNVLRAALTTLGVIIGVAAVIAIMEIGRGSASAIQRTIASMGANNLYIFPGTASSGGVRFGGGSVMTLTPEDSEAILAEVPEVYAAAPMVRTRTQVIYEDRNWAPHYIFGTTPAYLSVREWPLAAGEPFTDHDVRNANRVCLIGQRLVQELFQGESPVGKELRIQNVPFKVVGVLGSKGANMGMDLDDILLAPWTAIKFRVTGESAMTVNQSAASSGTSQQTRTGNSLYPSNQSTLYPQPSATRAADTPLPIRFVNVDQIVVATRSIGQATATIQQITQLLRERHRIRADDLDDFTIREMVEMTSTMASTSTQMTRLLLAVALVSLVVGGVGIMNIMLVSVMERTHEIGLRMAVGARGGNILQQFLLESVLLCFFGGLAGILLGRGISMLITALLRWPTELSLDAILMAFAVSAMVGILFGYYPAWKGSRLDPITALRYE